MVAEMISLPISWMTEWMIAERRKAQVAFYASEIESRIEVMRDGIGRGEILYLDRDMAERSADKAVDIWVVNIDRLRVLDVGNDFLETEAGVNPDRVRFVGTTSDWMAEVREYVRQALVEDFYDQAEEDYGKILFGDARGLGEPDTEAEDELEDHITKWFWGYEDRITPEIIKTFKKMRDHSLYSDFLSPPEGVSAHRYMSLAWQSAKKFSGAKVDTITSSTGTSIEVYEAKPRARLGLLKGRAASSWTIDNGVFSEMQKHWGWLLHYEEDDSLLFLTSNVDDNWDSFAFNPNESKHLAGDYGYQREVIQIGSVSTSGGLVYRAKTRDFEPRSFEDAVLSDMERRLS